MNEIEGKLAAAWEDEIPAARDAAFRIAVLTRVERRRFTVRMVLLLATGSAVIAAMVAFAPQLHEAAAAAPASAVLGVSASVFLLSIAWGLLRAFRLQLV